jgi:Thioredoxin-like
MIRTLTLTAMITAMVLPLGAQGLTEIDGHTAVIFNHIGRPPREALGYRNGVFVTPATLERFGVESNSVVHLRHPGAVIEARIFPVLGDSRRDGTIYMAESIRERLGVAVGECRIEVVAMGLQTESLGAPETELPPCGEPGSRVFQRVGRPPSESLDLGRAALVREDVLEQLGLPAGTPVTVTVGETTIEAQIHPLAMENRYETSLYLRRTLREQLGIEDGAHQVVMRFDPAAVTDTPSQRPDIAASTPDTHVNWRTDLEAAQSESRSSGRRLVVYALTDRSTSCSELESTLFAHPEVVEALNATVPVRIRITTDQAAFARFSIYRVPTLIVLSSGGQEIDRCVGEITLQRLIDLLHAQ